MKQFVKKDGSGGLPLVRSVSMGLRKGDTRLKAQLEAAPAKRKEEISELLLAYRVPIVPG